MSAAMHTHDNISTGLLYVSPRATYKYLELLMAALVMLKT